MELVKRAILAGVNNDLGSGSNVDITVVRRDGVQRFRNLVKAEAKYKSKAGMSFPRGTTRTWLTAFRNVF
jgi:20S proteasome subunit beta 2